MVCGLSFQHIKGHNACVVSIQPPNRQLGSSSRVRATVAPLPSSSSPVPPPSKVSRPALNFLSRNRQAPTPPLQEEDSDTNDCMNLK